MPNTFARYSLRTTDAPTATAFYDAVLGHHADAVFPLHEQAIARGAVPHWLGHLDVAEPEEAAASLLLRGGERYGQRPDGVVVLRDPGGAILALGGVTGSSAAGVTWHVLRSYEAPRAAETYAALFGWTLLDEVDLGPAGRFRPFCFAAGAPPSGVVGAVEGFPGLHPHWLYFFRVASVERAAAEVTARGGRVSHRTDLPDGRTAAVCEDPQRAAFGLIDG